MKQVQLQYKNKFALVDDEDYERISKYIWHAELDVTGIWYVKTNIRSNNKVTTIRLHRLVLNLNIKDPQVDHINGNGLDCQKHNLRLATGTQNQANRGPQQNNTSGYKGVFMRKGTGKYRAKITYMNKQYNLGTFNTKEEAALAYDKAAENYFGEFAWKNFEV